MPPESSTDLDGTISWATLLKETQSLLDASGAADNPRIEAKWIVEEVTGTSGVDFVEVLPMLATVRGVAKLDALVERRRAGEPIQYVLGHWPFRTLDLLIDQRVLIPRPETEVVAGLAMDELDRLRPNGGGTVVDLGTGSGAIGLAFAAERSVSRVLLTDMSAEALTVARANLAGLGVNGRSVEIAEGSWFDAIPGRYEGECDVIVSNPPYVRSTDVLPDSVADWEPSNALLSGSDGLDDLRLIVAGASAWLRAEGALVLEMDANQTADIATMAEAHGFDTSIHQDPRGSRPGCGSPQVMSAQLERDVDEVVAALRAGHVVIIPTDTVYGLAADPTSPEAMARLFALKNRPEGAPVAVLVGSVDQAEALIHPTQTFRDLASAYWPGALTLVTEVANGVDLHLGAGSTVGVRLPDHELIRECALAFGPIAATSANRHGEPTITNPADLAAAFGADIDVVIEGGVLKGAASTVVDITVEPLNILRQGTVQLDRSN